MAWTINNGKLYFNTILWTGASNTAGRSFTGVGFQPNLVWSKIRDDTYHHNWFDSVRGAGSDKEINSDTSGAEGSGDTDGYGFISSFDTDGFTSTPGTASGGRNLEYNQSGNTFVAWNWLAAGTAPSNTYAVKVVSDGGNKYRFDDFGTSAVTLEISEGGTFTFDQSDASNSGHPIRFSTTSDGTHNSGTEYTTGVTTNGTPGSAGAYTRITVAASAPTLYYYCSVHSGMGGQANTPTTNSFSSFNGTIQSNISPNTTSGFSIVSYTGTGNDPETIGHGLGVTPSMIIVKDRNTAGGWRVYNKSLGNDKVLALDGTIAGTTSDAWNSTTPTPSLFTVGNDTITNGNGTTHIAYCFADVQGFSKFGRFTSNGSTNNVFVYTGFKPAFVMMKCDNVTDGWSKWYMFDTARSPENMNVKELEANSSAVESGNGADYAQIDMLSNGFKLRNGSAWGPASSGNTNIYMAFAENPFTSSTGTPVTAR